MTEITLNYITGSESSDTITIKDFSFQWKEITWDGDEPSITGKRRNNHRGYQAYLELNFEHDEQLLSVAENIKTTLDAGGVVQYESDGDIVPVIPTSFTSNQDYKWQIRQKPSTLVLEGNIQSERAFIITGVLFGDTSIYWGDESVLWGVT